MENNSEEVVNLDVIQNIEEDANVPKKRMHDRWKLRWFILLGYLTLGIYDIVVMCIVSREINTIASQHDNRRTINYLWLLLLSIPTCFIYPLIWYSRLTYRVGKEQERRGLEQTIDRSDFWGWYVLASFLFGFGAWVYRFKLLHAMDDIAEDYNRHGR